jgi:hypothetical protein
MGGKVSQLSVGFQAFSDIAQTEYRRFAAPVFDDAFDDFDRKRSI